MATVYSEFNYIGVDELVQFIHTMSGVTNSGVAATFISDAERVIDAYMGPAPRFYVELTGDTTSLVASGATAWPSSIFGNRRPNYWAKGGLYVEILDAPGAPALTNQARLVVASSGSDQVTLASGFNQAVPAGTKFRLQQRSTFPRIWDRDTLSTPQLPPVLKRAVAYQVEYGILFGSEAFGLGDADVATDKDAGVQSRSYGSGYSETRAINEKRGLAQWVAPKARALLRSLTNSTGKLR